jgi:protein-disulfide isomerase
LVCSRSETSRGRCPISTRRRFIFVLGGAAALAAALIVASQVGAGDRRTASPPQPRTALFAGIPQHGSALGNPRAPITVFEYADLQCPYCAEWAGQALPRFVSKYVRTGRVRLVFRGMAFLGADSELALRMVVAARAQNKQWDLLDELYRRQGYENSGWVSDELDGAAAAVGLDPQRLDRVAWGSSTTRALAHDARAAQAAGVQGTPSFEVRRTGRQPQLVQSDSLEAALAR